MIPEIASAHELPESSITGYEQLADGAAAVHGRGREEARGVVAADGLHSVARTLRSDDQPVSSSYVVYRGAVPIPEVAGKDVSLADVVVYVGPAIEDAWVLSEHVAAPRLTDGTVDWDAAAGCAARWRSVSSSSRRSAGCATGGTSTATRR